MLRMLKNAKLSIMVLSFLEYKTNLIIFIVTKMIMSWNMLSSHLKAKEDVVSLFSDAVYEPKAMWGNIFVFFFQTDSTDIFCCFRLSRKNFTLKASTSFSQMVGAARL